MVAKGGESAVESMMERAYDMGAKLGTHPAFAPVLTAPERAKWPYGWVYQ